MLSSDALYAQLHACTAPHLDPTQLAPLQLLQAALGINTSLFSLSFILFNFLATATTPAVATAVSSSNNRAAGETIWQATSLAVVLGLLVAGGMLANGRWMLEVMGADQSQQHVQDLAMQYLWFRWVGCPAGSGLSNRACRKWFGQKGWQAVGAAAGLAGSGLAAGCVVVGPCLCTYWCND